MDFFKSLPFVVFFRRILFERKFSVHQNVNYFRGVFNNFEEAASSSPRSKPNGYDNPESAALYSERVSTIYSSDYPVLFWMQKLENQISNVFDFGGHVGIHFYSYSQVLNKSIFSNWVVCDVDSVIKKGESIRIKNDAKNLSFTSNFNDCDEKDLFLASGSLQYLDWSLGKKLMELKKPPKYLIINMLPLHSSIETITLQSIGVAFCPYKIRVESDFLNDLELAGYKVIDKWHNHEKRCDIAFEKERSINKYSGYLFGLENV